MLVPNRFHHSKKEQKRKLKPQALRQAKARRQALKRKLKGAFFYGYKPVRKDFCKTEPVLCWYTD